ncbi:TPA: phage tail tape measure protein [Enterococcus faecium]
MSADATINIDVMLSNLPKFKNDVSLIDDILSRLGINTGDKMDESFKQGTDKIQKQAEETKQKIDETIGKKTETKVILDDNELLKDIEKVKGNLEDIPEKISTKVSAQVDDQELKILEDDLVSIPSKTETRVEADTSSSVRNIEKLEETTDEASEGFSNLQEIIAGTFIGEQASKGFDAFKESSFNVIDRVTDLQDASNKLTNTLGLNADQTNKYRDVINDFYNTGFVESMDEAVEIVGAVNTQLGDMPADKLKEISQYASILQDQFGMDLNESLRGINSLMTNFGMSSDEAFDYMVKGAQVGLDKTDELGDNLAEYGQIWSQAGFDAKSMFSILDNGLKSGAYNLDKVNDFVKEFTISLNDGRIEENLGSFSKGTQKIFKEFKNGKATASDVFQNIISDLKNTKNQQEKLTTASTIWSALGEDNAMKVIESLGNVNDTFDNVSGTAKKTKENTEQTFSVRLRSDIRKITDELTPMGNKLLDLAEKKLPKLSNTGKNVFGDVYNVLDKTFSYLTNHSDDLVEIGENVKEIGKTFLSGAWEEGKKLFFDIADLFGLVDDKSKALKDPLGAINEIIGKIAKHKDEIELFGKALVVMFAVKKGYEFITMLKEARKNLLELTAIEKVTDFLSGGSFSLSKKSGGKSIATAGKEIIEDILPKGGAKAASEAVEDVAKIGVLSKLGSFGKSGSLKLISGIGKIAKIVPYIDVLSSASELFGKGSIGSKLGGFGGSLGGTAGGATAGAAIGSVVPGIGTGIGGAIGAAVGSISGTEIGKKLGKQIEKGLKEKKIDLDDIFKGDPSKKKFFKTYKSELEQLMKDTKSSEKSYEKLSSATDKYFRQKEKNSKDDLNTLLKNGDITKEEYNKFLKEDKRKNNTQKKNLKDNLKQMSQENERYNKEVTAINDKWDKKKNEQLSASAKTYGKNSKKYKEQEKQVTAQIEKERNKELLKARKGHEEKMTILSENTNKMVISDLKVSKGKQLDLLDDLKKNTKRISREKMKEVIQTSAKERDAQIKDANKAYKETVNSAEKKRNEVVDAADREYYDNHSISKKQHDDIVKKANDTYNSTKKTAKDQRDAIVKQARDTHKSVVNEATKQAGEHKGAVDAETGDVITSWTKMKNNLRGIVNGIVDGINVLLNGLHKGWGKIPKWGAHAKGSSGLTEDEIALVGEEGFELAHHPSKGIFPVGVSGPEIRPLQAGTSILPHHMSKEFLAMTKGLPAHKDGVWGTITNMFDWVKDKAKDVWSFVSDGAGKAYDTIADKLGVSDFLDNLGDSAEYKVAAGGISNIKDKIIEYAQNFFDKFNEENGGGSFDGAMADNVYKYLVDIANQAVRKFGMSGITSGYRPGDPYWHGKHQAIDIAYPSSMNGSSKYFDPANWVFENFADKVGYVITQGKVRDRTGQSGQPATGAWEPWPDNDHYDHLHITGKLGLGDIFKAGGGSSPAGSGAERWRSQVIEAAKMVGFPTDKGHIDRIISQIQTESGGNEKAVQGGYTDINTITGDLAKGLMQTISATFNAYKMPGHGNIFNGYDNILAGLRYIMARYGTGAGFFANIGMGHGYADGGEINGPELAWIGEDPAYPKEFMINPAKPSADDLIIKAIRLREQFRPASANNVSSNSSGFLTSEISENSLQKLSQALNNRPVKVISHLDGKKVSQSVDEYTGSSLARKLYTRGKNFNG